jgi:hypothetical protein
MSWNGKGGVWECYTCGQTNPYGYPKCLFCPMQKHSDGKSAGSHAKGAKGKRDYPARKGKGDYPPQDQKWGEKDESQNPERRKLGRMRQALKNAEAIDGWEDKIEDMKADIKEQLVLSNQEQGINKEEQAQILLKELQRKSKQLQKYKEAMDYHQSKGEENAKNHQTMDEDIEALYEELGVLGWNQVETETDGESEELDSDRPGYWEQRQVAQRQKRAKESQAQVRARHVRNQRANRGDAEHYAISDEEMDPEATRRERRAAATSAAARRVKAEKRADRPQDAGANMAPPVEPMLS